MGSLRSRLTGIATLVVLLVLLVASTGLFLSQRDELSENIDVSLSDRADAIEELLEAGTLPQSIVGDDEDRFIQVVDAAGRVLVSSDELDGSSVLLDLDPGTTETMTELQDDRLGDQSFRVLARPSTEGAVIYVAESLDDLEDTTRGLFTTLLVVVPAVALAFAALAWFLIGRTLRPVDALRADVDAITDTRDLRPLPAPARDDEIGRLTDTVNGMIARLRSSSEQQRRFVADAAHELRTPLTRIRTTVEVDLAQPDAADVARTNTEVQHEVIGMQGLIDDLLLLAASDDGAAPATERFDLDDVVTTEVGRFRADFPALRVDGSGIGACEMTGDETHLRRAVQNLLANACRHASSTVAVSLRELHGPDAAVELVVDDDGPGVPAAHRAVIFDRFTRLDEARTREAGGAGLGLAITRDIVARHGGSITCTDSPIGGARFTMRFPATDG